MSMKQAVRKVEDLGPQAWELASMALAIQEAIYRGTFSVEAYQGAMSALVAKAEAVRDQTQTAVDDLTSAYRLIAG